MIHFLKIRNTKAGKDASNVNKRGIYYHEHEVFMECEALKEVATSLATHDNLL